VDLNSQPRDHWTANPTPCRYSRLTEPLFACQ